MYILFGTFLPPHIIHNHHTDTGGRLTSRRHVTSGVAFKRRLCSHRLNSLSHADLIRGNVAQLGLALARAFAPHPHRTFGFHQLDQAAFVSLFSFLFGVLLGQADGLFGGATTRVYLMSTGIVQILFTVAAAVMAHLSGGHVSM